MQGKVQYEFSFTGTFTEASRIFTDACFLKQGGKTRGKTWKNNFPRSTCSALQGVLQRRSYIYIYIYIYIFAGPCPGRVRSWSGTINFNKKMCFKKQQSTRKSDSTSNNCFNIVFFNCKMSTCPKTVQFENCSAQIMGGSRGGSRHVNRCSFLFDGQRFFNHFWEGIFLPKMVPKCSQNGPQKGSKINAT